MYSIAILALLPAVLAKPLPRQTTSTAGAVHIHPSDNTNFCLGAAGTGNGALVDIYDCTTKTSSTPAWVLDNDKKRFQLSGTQMCLDAGNNPSDGTAMKIWQCYDNLTQQSWAYNNEHFSVGSGAECLDLQDGRLADGATTQTWACSASNANQLWTTTAATATTTPSTPSASGQALHPNGSSGKCLNVAGDVANGTPVQIDDCDDSSAQKFVLSRGTTAVKLAGTDFCLDAGEDVGNGASMKIWQCYEGLAQQTWYYTEDNRIAVQGAGQCLDVSRGDLTDGNTMQTWICTDGNTNQIWN
ncbi:ricin B lectin domain-containing protein [Schizophyllum amplum]|uniref:Ricin B lectin domain-containing protein n=1 Tax=Schizophyllum amplum TaxID=97359 RepID=A0A550BSG0_9AGAR|nr:ricin B lectin domain-containing protein [Auriculariopsis ampla]TRM61547.1 ricin B lectin domain-containing protein [Auriculariopsis ampla]